jgi:hypothetical protein
MNLPTPIDMMHLPALQQADVQMFLTDNQNQNWQSWVKPRGVSMCFMVLVNGGGGGGGGRQRAAGGSGGGGGGGGSGSISNVLIPAFLLPNELYIQVGLGGPGGIAGTSGTTGGISAVSLGRSAVVPNAIIRGGNTGGQPGGGGQGGSAGSGGNGGTTAAALPPSAFGLYISTAGVAGSAGGVSAGAVGVSITDVWNGIMVSGGAGGAGCTTTDFAGGAVNLTAAADFPAQNIPGGAAAGGNGNGGIQLWQPFAGSGGSGGGSNNSGQAGHGGKGGIGCGGGGGGCGTTAGLGGNGGNGMVLIISW